MRGPCTNISSRVVKLTSVPRSDRIDDAGNLEIIVDRAVSYYVCEQHAGHNNNGT